MLHPLPSAISLISARIVVIVSSHPYRKQQRLFSRLYQNHHDLFFANGLRFLQSPFVTMPPNHPTKPTEATSANYFPRQKDESGRA
jgi:hypothetical protein